MSRLVAALVAALIVVSPVAASSSGIATWYCCTKGYAGQAVVALPGAHYVPAGRPTASVHVCVRQDGIERCDDFPVVDFCACPGNRIVDLSTTAARRLGLDLSRGIWPATVGIGTRLATIPPTDMESPAPHGLGLVIRRAL